MHQLLNLSVTLAVLVAAMPGALAAKKGGAIAVLGLASEDAGPTTALADVLTAEVGRCGYRVVSKSDIESMLDAERLRDVMGCTEVACMAEIGGALGVEMMVNGVVAKVGDGFLVTLKLINSARASVENRVTMKWQGDPVELTAVVAAAAQELLLDPSARQSGQLALSGVPEGATVLVDEKPVTIDPARPVVAGLEIGPHALKLAAEDYTKREAFFVMRNGELLNLDGSLQAIEHPIYTRWWFWTGAAAVVAAAVAVPLIMMQGDNNEASGRVTIPSPVAGGLSF